MNRTLVEMARCLLLQASLPEAFWAEAIATAAYLRNRCPTKQLQGQTPYEVWFGSKPSISHLRPFGCKAFPLNKKPSKGKFERSSKPCVFVGYAKEVKAYRVWDPETRKIVESRDVEFDEERFTTKVTDEKESSTLFEIFFENKDWKERQPSKYFQ